MESSKAHRVSRQPRLQIDETENVSALEHVIDEDFSGERGAQEGSEKNAPTDREIDESIADLEERALEISRGGNADPQFEVDPQ